MHAIAKRATERIEAAKANRADKLAAFDPDIDREKKAEYETLCDPVEKAFVAVSCEEMRDFLGKHPETPDNKAVREALRIGCSRAGHLEMNVQACDLLTIAGGAKAASAAPKDTSKK